MFVASAVTSFLPKAAPLIDSSQVFAPREDPRARKSSEFQDKVVVVRKAVTPEIGPGWKRSPTFPIRRPPVTIELRATLLPLERGETFADLTLPTYLRAYLSGTSHCHPDPPA
jgi:hypothetical protein